MARRRLQRPWPQLAAIGLLAVLASPPLRGLLEASMSLHMLLQFPLLVLAGHVLAGGLQPSVAEKLQRWNAHGLTGLLAAALLLSLLMIPRLLDLALVDLRFEVAKWLALLATGAALRLSWNRAGLLGQFFFLGNMLPMTAMAGSLFIDSPLRVCNAYLLDDQIRVGQGLIVACVVVATAWLVMATRVLARQAEPQMPASAAE
ncbi:hypothetical protein [Ramlibacter sp.]|uniref:hypothetical protein n=1 Tax=Ramlibacter sp. TaxID=1917967 RepID=UPI002D46C10C|nr:hypothetical protein [Ramlibacter sp.]HYD76824.1 hypothetical protein [Ramlibacter sp.]